VAGLLTPTSCFLHREDCKDVVVDLCEESCGCVDGLDAPAVVCNVWVGKQRVAKSVGGGQGSAYWGGPDGNTTRRMTCYLRNAYSLIYDHEHCDAIVAYF
jgi:hypothetical protein